MNSDMVKPEKFGHLHLVYHFTVPLKWCNNDITNANGRALDTLTSSAGY